MLVKETKLHNTSTTINTRTLPNLLHSSALCISLSNIRILRFAALSSSCSVSVFAFNMEFSISSSSILFSSASFESLPFGPGDIIFGLRDFLPYLLSLSSSELMQRSRQPFPTFFDFLTLSPLSSELVSSESDLPLSLKSSPYFFGLPAARLGVDLMAVGLCRLVSFLLRFLFAASSSSSASGFEFFLVEEGFRFLAVLPGDFNVFSSGCRRKTVSTPGSSSE
mmetsp:Transcript_21453/g.36402  ORF Transcript_21453/g.36402 Transcript_21453/m.36402 type:complete len:223 (-) Transcript_21453:1714-2382(-)